MGGTYKRKDHHYRLAKKKGYRSRAAWKLLEVQKKHRFISKGDKILDLGCHPGGWLQVALELTGPKGLVIGVDLVKVEPIEGVKILKTDMRKDKCVDMLLELFGQKIDVLLSDMSPKLSGISFRDSAFCAELVTCAANTTTKLLKPGGHFFAKLFPGEDAEDVIKNMKKSFKEVIRCKLKSTRSTSSEFYILCKIFTPRNRVKNNAL